MSIRSTPAWVVNVRDEIGRSPAWEVLSDQLYERVAVVLKSHGLGHFSDLCEAEQITLLDEAHRELISEESTVYRAFEAQFSKCMDAEIAKEARLRLRQDEEAQREGSDEALYLERVLETAAEGAVSLLQELPREHLGSLRLMLNQPIPSRARLDIWRLLLKHTAMREEYELLMKQNRNSTISGQDVYITHRCQALLESGRVADRRLLALTSRNVILMKTVLSFYHACKMSRPGEKATTELPDCFIYFMVPLCAVVTRGGMYTKSFGVGGTGGRPGGGGAGGTAPATATASKEQRMELTIAELVELFQAALEAGLKAFLDRSDLRGSDKASDKGGETRARDGVRRIATGRETTLPLSGAGISGDGDEGTPPAWVDVALDALLPGAQGLVDHVTRVHLGLGTVVLRTDDDKTNSKAANDEPMTNATAGGTNDAEAKKGRVCEDDELFSLGDDDDSAEGAAKVSDAQQQTHQQNGRKNNNKGTKSASKKEDGVNEDRSGQQQRQINDAHSTRTGNGDGSATVQGSRRRSSARQPSLTGARKRSSPSSSTTNSSTPYDGDTKVDGQAELLAASGAKDRSTKSPEDNRTEESSCVVASPALDNIDAAAKFAHARAAIWVLLRPMVSVGLVGHLGAEACLFAWDQAVIAGFEMMLPRVAAMVLVASRDKLEGCATFSRMSDAFISHAPLVSTAQLQELMEKHCLLSIRAGMKISEKLEPEIVGPSLEAATQILDRAYSKRTRLVQEARKAHIEHALGAPTTPSFGLDCQHLSISKKADSTGNDDNSDSPDDDDEGGNDDRSNDRNVDKAGRERQDDHNTSKNRKGNTDGSDSRRGGKASRPLQPTDPPLIRRRSSSGNSAWGSGREGSPKRECRDRGEGEGKRADRGSGGRGGGRRTGGREGGDWEGGRYGNPDSLHGGDDHGGSDRLETRSKRRTGNVVEGSRSTGSDGDSAEVKKSVDRGNETEEAGTGNDQGRAVNESNKTPQQHRQTLRLSTDDADRDGDDSSKDNAGKRDRGRHSAELGAGNDEQQQRRHQREGLPERGKPQRSTSEIGRTDDDRSLESGPAERRSTGEDRMCEENDNAGSDKRRRERDATTDSSSQEPRGRGRRLRNGNTADSRQRFPNADENDHRSSGDDRNRMEQAEGGNHSGKDDGVVGGRRGGAAVDRDDGMRARRRPSEGRKVSYEDRGSREEYDNEEQTEDGGKYTGVTERRDSSSSRSHLVNSSSSRTNSFSQDTAHDQRDGIGGMNKASRSGRGWWWEKEAAAKEAEQARLATEQEEVGKAQLAVFKRTYTEAEIEALEGNELVAYTKSKAKLEKALAKLRTERERKERNANEAAAKLEKKARGGDKIDTSKKGEKGKAGHKIDIDGKTKITDGGGGGKSTSVSPAKAAAGRDAVVAAVSANTDGRNSNGRRGFFAEGGNREEFGDDGDGSFHGSPPIDTRKDRGGAKNGQHNGDERSKNSGSTDMPAQKAADGDREAEAAAKRRSVSPLKRWFGMGGG